VAMPGFLRPGRFEIDFDQGNFTEARLRTSLVDGLLTDVDVFIGANLAGNYRQNYEGSENALVGSASMMAASVDMRYLDRWLLNRRDQLAFFHLLGPTGKWWFAPSSRLMLRLNSDVHADFTALRSPAYELWRSQFGMDGTKSVLQLQGYYFGLGGSGRLAASVAYRGFELGGRAGYGIYRSIEGWDREQAQMFRDVTNYDQILELGAFASFEPSGAPIQARAAWEYLRHASQMNPVSTVWGDGRFSASLAFVF
jgi:hypothetical protein